MKKKIKFMRFALLLLMLLSFGLKAQENSDWYVYSETSKVYKNDKQIAEGYSSFCSTSSTKK